MPQLFSVGAMHLIKYKWKNNYLAPLWIVFGSEIYIREKSHGHWRASAFPAQWSCFGVNSPLPLLCTCIWLLHFDLVSCCENATSSSTHKPWNAAPMKIIFRDVSGDLKMTTGPSSICYLLNSGFFSSDFHFHSLSAASVFYNVINLNQNSSSPIKSSFYWAIIQFFKRAFLLHGSKDYLFWYSLPKIGS